MKLSTLYQSLDKAGRDALATRSGIDPGYLWQIATGWRGKRPSIDVIGRLCRADRRLKPVDLIAEFAGAPVSKEAEHV